MPMWLALIFKYGPRPGRESNAQDIKAQEGFMNELQHFMIYFVMAWADVDTSVPFNERKIKRLHVWSTH